jgi:hypothetical protein
MKMLTMLNKATILNIMGVFSSLLNLPHRIQTSYIGVVYLLRELEYFQFRVCRNVCDSLQFLHA